MKLVYMGTPDIARVCLEKLHTAGFDIAAVYTKPDTPKNRGMKMMASEVKQYAESVGGIGVAVLRQRFVCRGFSSPIVSHRIGHRRLGCRIFRKSPTSTEYHGCIIY